MADQRARASKRVEMAAPPQTSLSVLRYPLCYPLALLAHSGGRTCLSKDKPMRKWLQSRADCADGDDVAGEAVKGGMPWKIPRRT
jgi:hypothetical protein